MKRKLCLLLLGIAILGMPVFAQSDDEIVIDLGSASDEELNQALDSSADIEMATKEQAEAPVEESGIAEEPAIAEESGAVAGESGAAGVAEEPAASVEEPAAIAEEPAADAEPIVPYRVRNNKYFQESQRFARLAEGTYTLGDYDASTDYANEAIRNAELSDEYVALQMKIREANSAIAAAKYRIDWAVSSGASKQFPVEFREAETWYNESLSARIDEEWDNAIDAAHRVVELLAYIDAPAGTLPLPAQYTVRSWSTFKDCLWNIAGRPWVYGNPRQWRVLYNANRAKFPDPNNPNWIEPGMVLDIPSIKGEFRQGSWDGNRSYPAID
jgi:nucleoid-associated protein YgaU